MKTFHFILTVLMCSFAVNAQNCNIGNQDTTSFSSTGTFSANNLLGVSFELEKKGTLKAIGLIGKLTNSKIQMAIYNDSLNKPNNLLLNTEIEDITEGEQKFIVSDTILDPGKYWIMANYSNSGQPTYKKTGVNENFVYFTELPFGSDIPENAQNFNYYTGQDFTYFMEIECLTVETNNYKWSTDLVHPNPVQNTLFFERESQLYESNTELILFNASGIGVKTLEVTDLRNGLDVSELPKGMYYINSIDNSINIKFLKH